MAESDALLLERFSHQADAQAFSELVHQYARLVYGTAFRILHNQSDAADISQETFIALHQQAGRISGSLTAWLHRVATNKAFDLLRRTRRRSHREEAYALSRSTEIQTWQALSGQVDKALEKLDRPLRAMLLDHFMAGKTETQIARDRGISQATVSRHINDGLSQLRGILKRQGALVAGAAALSTMLMESSVQAVPDAVMGELSKLAMVGTGSIAAGSGGMVAGLTKAWAVKATLTTAALVGVVSIAGYVYHSRSRSRPAESQVSVQSVATQLRMWSVVMMGGALGGGQVPQGDALPTPKTTDRVDFSTPRAAVLSFLTLVDQGDREAWTQWLAAHAGDLAASPYLRYLGLPVQVGNPRREGDMVVVACTAMAQTAFTRQGKEWYPGESVPLRARLVQEDDLWKLAALSE